MTLKNSRFQLLILAVAIFLLLSFVSRTSLLITDASSVDLNLFSLLKVYGVGFIYDFVASMYYVMPLAVYLLVVPDRVFNSKTHKYIFFAIFFGFNFSLVFNVVSEWFFWEEFGKRFNFIAVDYLVYTHEVINNILESYPMPTLVSAILFANILLSYLIYKKVAFVREFHFEDKFFERLKLAGVALLLPLIFFNIFNKQDFSKISKNMYNNELAKNGFYSLFSAFRNNTLDYTEYYKTLDHKVVMKEIKTLVGFNDKSIKEIKSQGEERKHNIMLILVESLSAKYMGAFGDKKGWTPKLDALTKKSLFFENFYATGTRTVRGMEAITLSVVPTPGRSIVKRPDNHNMFSTGFIFKEKGYENKFIYGGHGYFDNMNDFFSHNGFSIVDRTDFADNEVTFSNVWGACDEDLFNKVLKEADKSYADKKPFLNFIMTTSNHRPYTYPDGKIDVPSHTGREGGVKYTDYAINKFINEAKKKPWFKNTIFIILADHNGGSAGKTTLPAYRYKIPLIVYAPNIVKPEVVNKLSSQIDLFPTIFSLMNWNYESMFYGADILSKKFKERAFIGNYQKLGLMKNGYLFVLTPDKKIHKYKIIKQTLYDVKYEEMKDISDEEIRETISYYQSATYFFKNHINRWKEK